MATAPPETVRVAHRFAASAEEVFDAWLDPERAARFLFATPTGQIVQCDIDARVGGKFLIIDRRDGGDVAHVGEYLEMHRPMRLVFDFAVPKYSAQVTRVTIAIAPLAAGCELTLTHENVLAEWASQTEEGWKKILEGLESSLQ